ncbi:nucleotidyltransferase domain-containing protein [Naasia aerilata]|uniref:Aminoglycoside nucleotidyltransferase n=1 Tax=Naasia aerilata TaxID=1162966 RepID=A0ABN6XRQ8_9MICO|nr:amino acid transporter [Naasia aerilata]BDZ47681.1 aminoglycoside nucleotidyltransferase [Naasia aerilata]
MSGDEAVAVLEVLAVRGLGAWVAGGWAVDALVGRQTRDHGDLDLAVDAAQLPDVLAALAGAGLLLEVDELPARAVVAAGDGRRVDLHPVAFAADGSGVQRGHGGTEFSYAADGFAEGVIEGVRVPCLSAAQQLRFREGYEPRPVDHHDVPLLRALLTPPAE